MNTLKKGSRGDDVLTLQHALHLVEDGIFGTLTEEAVKDYQRANGLTPDGIVGPKTWAKLGIPTIPAFDLSTTRRINEIIVHCSATTEGNNVTVDTIRRYHIVERGWSDIGYHFVIYLDGSVHAGRPLGKIGAHCTGHNSYSIGICYVGGLDHNGRAKDTRTDAQKASLVELLRTLKRRWPKATIHGHREFALKDCPCFNARSEYANL